MVQHLWLPPFLPSSSPRCALRGHFLQLTSRRECKYFVQSCGRRTLMYSFPCSLPPSLLLALSLTIFKKCILICAGSLMARARPAALHLS